MTRALIIKYLLFPGVVRSQFDGDLHVITAKALAGLYKVNPAECVEWPGATSYNRLHRARLLEQVDAGTLIKLTPRYDGNYTLPLPAAKPKLKDAST